MNQNAGDRNRGAVRPPQLVWAFLVCFSAPIWGQPSGSGQQQATPGQTAPAPDPAPTRHEETAIDANRSVVQPPASGTSKDRLFFALPNFLTLENAGQVPPLTVGQKFKVVARGSFDYIQIPWYAALAGIS